MNFIKSILLCSVIFVLIFSQNIFSQDKITIAVYDLTGDDMSSSALSVLTNLIRQELMRTNQYTVVDRNKMEQIFKEYGYQQSGCTSVECLVEIGQMLSAQKIIGGSIGKLGNKFIINIQLIDVESSAMEKLETENYIGPIEDLDSAIRNVTKKIAGKGQYLKNSYIYISSVPQGANVYINSIFKGNAPLKIPVDMNVRYAVKVSLGGYADWQQTVEIRKNEPKILNAILAKLNEGNVLNQNNSNLKNLTEWELMGISRNEWIDFKRAGFTYDDWIKYKPIGLDVNKLIKIKKYKLLDSLNTSLNIGIPEWEYLNISLNNWILEKLPTSSIKKLCTLMGISSEDLMKIIKYDLLDSLDTSLSKGVPEWKTLNITLDEWIFKKLPISSSTYKEMLKRYGFSRDEFETFKKRVRSNIRSYYLTRSWRNYKKQKNKNFSYQDFVDSLTPKDWITYKKSGKFVRDWLRIKLKSE